jgi:hypothetical protein
MRWNFLSVATSWTCTSVLIQASTSTKPYVLQADVDALLLAAKIATLLQIQEVTFFTYNNTLAMAEISTLTSSPHVQRETKKSREYIADRIQLTHAVKQTMFHIMRDLNKVATIAHIRR